MQIRTTITKSEQVGLAACGRDLFGFSSWHYTLSQRNTKLATEVSTEVRLT